VAAARNNEEAARPVHDYFGFQRDGATPLATVTSTREARTPSLLGLRNGAAVQKRGSEKLARHFKSKLLRSALAGLSAREAPTKSPAKNPPDKIGRVLDGWIFVA